MNRSFRSHRRPRVLLTLLLPFALLFLPLQALPAQADTHMAINCAWGWASQLCTEVHDAKQVFGGYVGHDEPSVLFYSNQPGSGNAMTYQLTLPSDPPKPPAQADRNRSTNFELHPAFWFGMAMCDTQSYPEQVSTCAPDSDSNITALAKHPGTAFMEMQFYPPGWVPWPAGVSCDPTKWCAALNIDSLSEDPVNGTVLNDTCASIVGLEYVNFAFITLDGKSQAPPNPVDSTLATFTPNPSKDLFMNSGDQLGVRLHDTAHGLNITINDLTTGQTGSMTASAANGFGQVKYAPTGKSCVNIPYDFHPMYSTSSEQTRVIWAAHSYNIAFSDEIGHFDYCTGGIDTNGSCTGLEGITGDQEAADVDDNYCFPASDSTLVQVSGCLDTNTGFDGVSYQLLWPDGNTALHPTPIQFSSPVIGTTGKNYERIAFETDLPRIEAADFGGPCDRTTGAGCTLIPETDDGTPATFYPFYSITASGGGCSWLLGNDVRGMTIFDFGKNAQYGTLLPQTFLVFGGGGATRQIIDDFRNVLPFNPCPVFRP